MFKLNWYNIWNWVLCTFYYYVLRAVVTSRLKGSSVLSKSKRKITYRKDDFSVTIDGTEEANGSLFFRPMTEKEVISYIDKYVPVCRAGEFINSLVTELYDTEESSKPRLRVVTCSSLTQFTIYYLCCGEPIVTLTIKY